MSTASQPCQNWLERWRTAVDDVDKESLGSPDDPVGWQHGVAGSVRDNRRIDCWLEVVDGGIRAARFEVFASDEARRAAVWTVQWLQGQAIAQAEGLTGLGIAEATNLPDASRSDALCIEDALRAALAAPPTEGG